MPPRGWYARYAQIAAEFGYSAAQDAAAAQKLDAVLGARSSERRLASLIGGRDVFVIGAGPSLRAGVRMLAANPRPARIAADGAAAELVARRMRVDAVVTDLDGGDGALCAAARRGAVMVVHAHGDNAHRLGLARSFARVVGTTQVRPVGGVRNYGGFTDGDRCAFVAHALGARSITLLGMDLGGRLGARSMTPPSRRATKLKKLQHAARLLEWLASYNRTSLLYTASGALAGYERVAAGGAARGRRMRFNMKGAAGRRGVAGRARARDSRGKRAPAKARRRVRDRA